ncbi:MAG: DUF3793 family protein [Johnsonella sp.]|nr:DUF3793 family protein [Johnsonella sp.]
MSADRIVEILKTSDAKRKTELRIILQIAFVLKGYKEAGMLFIENRELQTVREHIKRSSLRMSILYSDKKRLLLFIYRKYALDSYLSLEGIRGFLKGYGYLGRSVEDFLPKLRERIADFYRRSKLFPHEVGAFLGYPLCDIEGYVDNQGGGYLFSGYWKVYDNLEMTLERFAEFDRAKYEAIDEWLSGKEIYEIAS